jgi:hypothetical protein
MRFMRAAASRGGERPGGAVGVDRGAAAEAGQDDVVLAHDWAVMTGFGEEVLRLESPARRSPSPAQGRLRIP